MSLQTDTDKSNVRSLAVELLLEVHDRFGECIKSAHHPFRDDVEMTIHRRRRVVESLLNTLDGASS